MKLVVLSVAYFVVVIVVAHLFAPVGYHWNSNTVSELASQGHNRKWIMQAGFIGFGVLLNAGVVCGFVEAGRVSYADLPIMSYGLAVLLSGFFCAPPIDETISYSLSEARLHSTFAFTAGISLSLGILWHLLVSGTSGARAFHLLFLVLVLGGSLVFGLSESGTISLGKGVVQRLLYLSGVVWLVLDQYWKGI